MMLIPCPWPVTCSSLLLLFTTTASVSLESDSLISAADDITDSCGLHGDKQGTENIYWDAIFFNIFLKIIDFGRFERPTIIAGGKYCNTFAIFLGAKNNSKTFLA